MDFSFYVLQKAIRTNTSVHASVVNQRKTFFFSFKNLMFSNFVYVTLFLMTSLNLNTFLTNNLRRVVWKICLTIRKGTAPLALGKLFVAKAMAVQQQSTEHSYLNSSRLFSYFIFTKSGHLQLAQWHIDLLTERLF